MVLIAKTFGHFAGRYRNVFSRKWARGSMNLYTHVHINRHYTGIMSLANSPTVVERERERFVDDEKQLYRREYPWPTCARQSRSQNHSTCNLTFFYLTRSEKRHKIVKKVDTEKKENHDIHFALTFRASRLLRYVKFFSAFKRL